uniref:PKD domain-containing protein n=1 Tax=candidate division WOR-3 bacterium TaxID=2052148 RepID=A0A7C4CB38_UNCW3
MLTAVASLLAFILAGIPAPDSVVVPERHDTESEMEIAVFPPRGVRPPLSYRIDWGDGETLDWTEPLRSLTDISRFHRYRREGVYSVRVMIRDSSTQSSEWSRPKPVRIGPPLLKWVFPTSEPVVASPALDSSGNIYIGDESGTFYSISPAGTLRWSFSTRGPVYASAAVAGNRVLVASLDSSLYCLDTLGRQLWSLNLDDEVYSGPALGPDGTAYIATDSGYLIAVDVRGKRRWRVAVGAEIPTSPTVGHNGRIYVSADSVYCFDSRGRRVWTFGTPDESGGFFAAPVPDLLGNVYVGSADDGHLYSIGPNGRLRWRAPVPDEDEIHSEVVFGPGDTLYFGTDGDYLCRLAPGGTVKVIHEAYDILTVPPAISDSGTLYFLPDDGILWAVRSSGRLVWKQALAGGDKDLYYTSAPTIGPDGTVYVGSWDGGLYAFRGDGPPARTIWPQFRRDAQRTGRLRALAPKR